MKIIIVGGVGNGASVAARLRKLNENAEIIILERNEFIFSVNPYYVKGEYNDHALRTLNCLKTRYNIDARMFMEVLDIDPINKSVKINNIKTNHVYTENYDKLIISSNFEFSESIVKNINNKNVLALNSIQDMLKIKNCVENENIKNVVIIGGSYIGIEIATNMKQMGIDVIITETADRILPSLDYDISCDVYNYLVEKGIKISLSNDLKSIDEQGGKLNLYFSKSNFITDMVIDSTRVDIIKKNFHSYTDIYDITDATNIQARAVADNIYDINKKVKNKQNSSLLRVFDMTIASTGITEMEAKSMCLNYEKIFTFSPSHSGYYSSDKDMSTKVIFEKNSGKILGIQIVGYEGVESRCNVFSVAIRAEMTAADIAELELSYTPPFSSAVNPVNYIGRAIENIMIGNTKIFHWHDVKNLPNDGSIILLDVRRPAEFELGNVYGSINIELDVLRQNISLLDKTKTIYLICRSGVRSYIASRILTQNGFNCYNLSGGYRLYNAVVNNASQYAVDVQCEDLYCFVCCIRQIPKDIIALNKKLLGRNIERFFCLDCFSEHFDITKEELLAKINDFKEQGCSLF